MTRAYLACLREGGVERTPRPGGSGYASQGGSGSYSGLGKVGMVARVPGWGGERMF